MIDNVVSKVTTSTDVLVVGGGLSGCVVARELSRRGTDFTLIDARARLGGRILTRTPGSKDNHAARIDLGPSWFWPHQRTFVALLQSLGLEQRVYEQAHHGDSIIEYASGQLERRAGAVSMAGSYRLDGGMSTLIDSISKTLDRDRIRLTTRLASFAESDSGITATLNTDSGDEVISCQTIILALPPRLLAATVEWQTKDAESTNLLNSISTWMASEAKITLIYDEPFWLTQGLSGDAMSQIGPMAEIHDATPRNSTIGALFGFLAARPQQRANNEDAIKQESVQQIQKIFNTKKTPSTIIYKDWAADPLTASSTDATARRAHPSAGGLKRLTISNRVIWAGSEAATQDAGYLEGAVNSANAAVQQLAAT